MKAIRVAMMAVALSAAATSVSSAQQQPEQASQNDRRMGGMILRGITLTEAQKAQQKVIREKYAPQLLAIRKDAQTSGTPMNQAKLNEIRAAQAAELRAILTADQQVIYDRNLAEMRARQAERGAGQK
jgi:Spy/CpxP family protein refolding chaperone